MRQQVSSTENSLHTHLKKQDIKDKLLPSCAPHFVTSTSITVAIATGERY